MPDGGGPRTASGSRRGGNLAERQKLHRAKEERASGPPGGGNRGSPFLGRREPGLAAPEPSLNNIQARALSGACTTAVPKGVLGLRHRTTNVRNSLVGVELNPGPAGDGTRRGRRGVGYIRGRDRVQRKHERRRERRRARNERQRMEDTRLEREQMIVTWNVQKVSLREENRRRLRRVCEKVEKEGWEIVLLTEVTAAGDGVVWLGEGGNRIAVIHSAKAGILLRGDSLDKWIEDGSQKWYGERVVSVVLGGMRLVSWYQPIWGSDEVGRERIGETWRRS